MDGVADGSEHWLTVAEAAPRLGLTVDGLRSRIRRGLVTTRKGNDGRLLVSVSMDAASPGHDLSMDGVKNQDEAQELREEVTELRIALARAEERLVASERREADLAAEREREREREREQMQAETMIEEMRAMLAEARRPWWRRWMGS